MTFRGTGTCGMALGEALVVKKNLDKVSYQKGSPDEEMRVVTQALQDTKDLLLSKSHDEAVFSAHFEIADDPELQEAIEAYIHDGMSAPDAIDAAMIDIEGLFRNIDDEYLQARADDVRDVCLQIKDSILNPSRQNPFQDINQPCVLVTDELLPSDISLINFEYVQGIVTAKGNRTSHVCIITANKGIPMLVNAAHCMEEIKQGDYLCLNASEGWVQINPDEESINHFRKQTELHSFQLREMNGCAMQSATTVSGKTVPVMGNAGSLDDIKTAVLSGADGIGLFRSEFLFMQRDGFPDEETQFQVYEEAARLCGEKTLTIRTLDIGGDKSLPYMPLPKEENPFLGQRGIRFCLANTTLFKTQIRAILRASHWGNVQIMLPFISDISELEKTLALIEECKKELEEQHFAFDAGIKTGIMVETPSVVLLASEFASRTDFFSIGTNDLTQYIMVADRGNAEVSEYYVQTHPAVLRAIEHVAEAAHKHHIPVSVCGELASDPESIQLLLKAGIDKLSVNASAIALVKDRIRHSH